MPATETAPVHSQPSPVSRAAERPDIVAVLSDLARKCDSARHFYRAVLRAFAYHYRALYAEIVLDLASGTLEEVVQPEANDSTNFRQVAQTALLDCQAKSVAVCRYYHVASRNLRIGALAAPILDDSDVFGAVCVLLPCESEPVGEALLAELRALVAVAATSVPARTRRKTLPSGKDELLKAIAGAAHHSSLREFAFAVTNGLCNKMNLAQVAMGVVRKKSVELLSISGFDDVNTKSSGTQCITQAMEECLDGMAPISCRSNQHGEGQGGASGHRLHRQWHQQAGGAAVVSLPLLSAGRCVAVVSARGQREQLLGEDDIRKMHDLVRAYGPVIELLDNARRGLCRHCLDTARAAAAPLLRRKSWGRKALAGAALGLAAWFCLGRMDYIISVPGTVVPADLCYVSAPFEGPIAAAHVRPGDQVGKGQLLYEMDTSRLELKTRELASQIDIARVQAAAALAADDTSAVARANARIEGKQAQLDIIQRQIRRGRYCAPEDGTVIAGHLDQRVGEVVPLGAPLLELARGTSVLVEIQVPEAVAVDVQPGLDGTLACNTRPEQSWQFHIDQIRPRTQVVRGKNVFVANGVLAEQPPAWMRPGMEGIARIDAGRRGVWWVALHRLIAFVRRTLGV